MRFESAVQQLLGDFRARRPIRAKSLLMTIFGDTLEPRGGCVWLGSLIQLARPLGVSESLVRTSVYRLAREQWLAGTSSGRRSYYRLTPTGHRQFANAEHRIYGGSNRNWDGDWRVVVIPRRSINRKTRDTIRKELKWQGFGMLAADVLIHPTADLSLVSSMLTDRSLTDKVKVIRGRSVGDGESPQALLSRCFDLDHIAREYDLFNQRFSDLFDTLRRPRKTIDGEAAFVGRTLLIHEYRRILLRDPDVPETLLPSDWPGTKVRRRCAAIYRALRNTSDQWVIRLCEKTGGPIEPPKKDYSERFKR
ncbi:MAG: phenylacetic acid degradation operon negative regulatory protein PaaX [Pseudomonadota bacterium]|nr:phenylacetic acid degradation operon negative regulatory protein PaaX [Pseudomonadota bacterium]